MDRASSAGGIGVSVRAGSGGHKDTRGDVSLVSGLAVGRRAGGRRIGDEDESLKDTGHYKYSLLILRKTDAIRFNRHNWLLFVDWSVGWLVGLTRF